MKILNILTTVFTEVKVYDGNIGNFELTGATQLVAKIIEKFSIGGFVAVGIILFTLLLKIIPLPLDIYSRVATKKNALKMERIRPELEKLQRQYANNKELYSQKMMALYKKEGYSTFASCLPTIITLVFFIIVITAFTQYSTYAKVNNFEQMAVAYSDSIRQNENVELRYGEIVLEEGEKKGTFKDINTYYISKEQYDALSSEDKNKYLPIYGTTLSGDNIQNLIITPAQDAAADYYLNNTKAYSFLWVKNIWIEDLPWKKAFVTEEVYKSSTFTYSKGCGCSTEEIETSISGEEIYEVLMGSEKLNEVKEQSNGYMILVVLSIGSMLLSQLIMTKSQKAQLELQSVDPTAQQTSKMMMWMMPIMFGIFSFMYTASFSIYLIISTLFSMLSTILINKIVETKFKKAVQKEEEEKYNKRYGHLRKK